MLESDLWHFHGLHVRAERAVCVNATIRDLRKHVRAPATSHRSERELFQKRLHM